MATEERRAREVHANGRYDDAELPDDMMAREKDD